VQSKSGTPSFHFAYKLEKSSEGTDMTVLPVSMTAGDKLLESAGLRD
jgi:hypothetical protein